MSDFQGLVTLTLTLDRVILHSVKFHQSSTSTYIRNCIEIEETVLWTDGRTYRLIGSRDLTTLLSGMVCHTWASTCYDQHSYQILSLYLYPL